MILSLKMALRSIRGNKLRSALTMLGIIIGVMALVVLVSLVNGATTSVTEAVSGLGSSRITVTISDSKGKPLTLDDLNGWAAKEDAIGTIAAYTSTSATAKQKEGSSLISLYGATPSYYGVDDLRLAHGRWLKSADMDNVSSVCVLNESAAKTLVGYTDCVGESITLNSTLFTVVGVLTPNEDSLTAIITSGLPLAYIPYTTLIRFSDSVSREITTFYVSAADGYTVARAEKAVKALLNERFSRDKEAFDVSSQDILEDAMGSITNVLEILLGGIAAISLIVGGIGIMNIMLVTVTERTREIGIRKAIGASRGTILAQFLLESVVLCMFGCALGIFLSWGILQIVSAIVAELSVTFALQWNVVWLSVVFCFVIGVIFGLYPANKAAKMKPIDALHYGG